MRVAVVKGGHPPDLDGLVPPARRDLHHEADVMRAFEADGYGIVVHDDRGALFNAVGRNPISGGLHDVEPILGYAGLVATSGDPDFLSDALAAYSGACRELGIVAELIRFNPFLQNHRPFEGRPELRVVAVKSLVAVTCAPDPQAIAANFSAPARRRLRAGLETLRAELLPATEGLPLFRRLYERSMRRVRADEHWIYGDDTYAALKASGRFEVAAVWQGDTLLSSALVGRHETAWHYVLAANADETAPGSGERLVYEIACAAGAAGAARLMLGGGVGAADDDPLLRFKSRFARERLTFRIGQMVHDRDAFAALQAEAIARRPELAGSSYFLKHRL